jgi:hypothetical protein
MPVRELDYFNRKGGRLYMSVYDDSVRGRPEYVLPLVRRKLSAYTRVDKVSSFKIGITNNPLRRFRQVYAGLYNKMVVLYCSPSINSVSIVEYELIDHNWEFADNVIAGGGGRIGTPPYFLYVVTR